VSELKQRKQTKKNGKCIKEIKKSGKIFHISYSHQVKIKYS